MTVADLDAPITERALRDAMRSLATGVVIVTTRGDAGVPVGLTVNSFNSVSLQPPLVLWSIRLEAPSLSAFRSHGAFAVNILAADQRELAERFAARIPDRFNGVSWSEGYEGVPVLGGCLAALECRSYARHPGGDHEIHLGEVVNLTNRPGVPLIFQGGRYAALDPASAVTGTGPTDS